MLSRLPLLALVGATLTATASQALFPPPPPPAEPGAVYKNKIFSRTPDETLQHFDIVDRRDPSGGVVNYVDEERARSHALFGAGAAGGFRMGADATRKQDIRDSVRMEAKQRHGQGLYVWDIHHLPTGCGTWPALWTCGANWPHRGEIDLIEGANGVDARPNAITLHTGPDCSFPNHSKARKMVGSPVSANCRSDNHYNNNRGCGVSLNQTHASYGRDFNLQGGGVYAMLWDDDEIAVWFWPRNLAPWELTSGGANAELHPSKWGQPAAHFPSAAGGCDVGKAFGPQQITYDIDFCGGPVEAFWEQDGCASRAKGRSCHEFVAQHPEAFTEAYFDINSFGIWEKAGSS